MRLVRGDRHREAEADAPAAEETVTTTATFISGLSLGALAGAIVVGSVLLRRAGGRGADRGHEVKTR